MKVMPSLLLSVVLGLSANAALAYSPDNTHALPENGGCHLMTAQECLAHLGRLSQLPAGEERAAYLAAHQALMQERAALCGTALNRNSLLTRAAYR